MNTTYVEFNKFYPKPKKNVVVKDKKKAQIRRRLEDRLEQLRIEQEYGLLG